MTYTKFVPFWQKKKIKLAIPQLTSVTMVYFNGTLEHGLKNYIPHSSTKKSKYWIWIIWQIWLRCGHRKRRPTHLMCLIYRIWLKPNFFKLKFENASLWCWGSKTVWRSKYPKARSHEEWRQIKASFPARPRFVTLLSCNKPRNQL